MFVLWAAGGILRHVYVPKNADDEVELRRKMSLVAGIGVVSAGAACGNAHLSDHPPVSASPLAGRHILIVEDEMILALDLEDIIKDFGCTSAMVSRVGRAIPLIATQAFGAAILDLNLAGEQVYPVADELIRRSIPFVFATGYGVDGVDPAYRSHPVLAKPYSRHQVEAALLQALAPIP